MKKKLLRSEKDLIEFFLEELEDFNIIEKELDIEFPFEDGTYHSDPPKYIQDSDEAYEKWEAQEARTDVFRANENSLIPEQYPCVLVFTSCEYFNVMEYVYKTDFE